MAFNGQGSKHDLQSLHTCEKRLIDPVCFNCECRSIYLGETLCSYISVGNHSNFDVSHVIVKVCCPDMVTHTLIHIQDNSLAHTPYPAHGLGEIR